MKLELGTWVQCIENYPVNGMMYGVGGYNRISGFDTEGILLDGQQVSWTGFNRCFKPVDCPFPSEIPPPNYTIYLDGGRFNKITTPDGGTICNIVSGSIEFSSDIELMSAGKQICTLSFYINTSDVITG